MTRRQWLQGALIGAGVRAIHAQDNVSLVTITLDCEMSMHYPTRGQTEWNYK